MSISLMRITAGAVSLLFAASSLGAGERAAETAVVEDVQPPAAVHDIESVTFDALACAVATLERSETEVSEHDAKLIAKTLYGECRSCTKVQQAAVAWCILNRADYYGMSVEAVVTSPGQFAGYSESNPVDDALYEIAADVLRRHALESEGAVEVGRVLPRDYLWFSGDGYENHFRNAYIDGERWDWSLPNPYYEAA